MAITITGGKYAVASLNAVGTTTVTVGTTPFVSGDFASPRRVDLYNSAGTTFKGTAFVRKYNSTSQLELETEFFDPKTGATVAQVSGDTLFVSKNWADSVTAGIAVSGNVVTVTDTITFGTASDIDSVCFHDESVVVNNTVATGGAALYVVAGGGVSFGHLQSYANKSWYNGVTFNFTTTNLANSFTASSTAARMLWFGGSQRGSGSNSLYTVAGHNGGAAIGTDWAHFWALGVRFNASDILSKSAGGNWTTGSDHVLEDCTFIGTGTNQILVRFGNGSILGGTYKIPNNSSAPISVFGSDTAGTYAVGAPADIRSIILDMGSSNAFWRSSTGVTQTINITNLISTDYRAGTSSTPESSPNTNATKNIYFQDSYTNLQTSTALGVIQTSSWTLDDSQTSSGASQAVTAFHSTATGSGTHTSRGPWTYRIRKYGYDEIEGTFDASSYALGSAGTAFDVSFGGRVTQIARSTLTDSEATALAYAGITVTDHGASPVTWNSKSFSITISVDLATYPTRTAAQVFAHVKAKIASTATWGSKAGLLWHVLMEESGSGYASQRGVSGGAGASLKGVRIIDQAGNSLPGMVVHVADDGTTYIPPSADTRGLQFTGLVAGSFVRIVQNSDTAQKFVTTSSGTGETWSEAASGSLAVSYMIMRAGYEPIGPISTTVTGAVSGGVLSVPVTQVPARWYQAASGLTINTNAFANATTKKFGLTVGSTLQNFASYLLEQWIALGGTGGQFANKPWPLQANGPNSFTWLDGWEADLTTYPNTITNFSRDGMRYVSAAGAVTAIWAAILSANVPAGARVRFRQGHDLATQSAVITSGNMDQLVQVFGDATHGNVDYRGFLDLKVQESGYDEATADAVALYGTLEDQLYVVGLAPTPNGLAPGDPGVTGVTITDHGASPVAWNPGAGADKAYSITITDSGSNSGTAIMRWLRWAFEQGGAFQGNDAFSWHDLVRTNGSKFRTVRGPIYGDVGATLKGVRVIRGTSTPHPDWDLFTADDGTTAAPPSPPVTLTVAANVSLAGAVVSVFDLDGTPSGSYGTLLGGAAPSAGATVDVVVAAGNAVSIQILKDGYVESNTGYTMPGVSATATITLDPDPNA